MLFEIDKEVKHSRRYKSNHPDFPIDTVYVKRPFADDNEDLEITIEEFDESQLKEE